MFTEKTILVYNCMIYYIRTKEEDTVSGSQKATITVCEQFVNSQITY